MLERAWSSSTTIGTRQLLELLRLQDRYGFRMVAIGDPKRCQVIEAGFVTLLLEGALGLIPSIETSVRQTDPRARQITELLRQGEAAAALDMKREDGSAEIVPGGYRDMVARAAALWHERHGANAGRADYTLTVSAPTNDDARAIGEAIRVRLQADGSLGRNRKVLEATDPNGGTDYPLRVAVGDQLRLFARTPGDRLARSAITGRSLPCNRYDMTVSRCATPRAPKALCASGRSPTREPAGCVSPTATR